MPLRAGRRHAGAMWRAGGPQPVIGCGAAGGSAALRARAGGRAAGRHRGPPGLLAAQAHTPSKSTSFLCATSSKFMPTGACTVCSAPSLSMKVTLILQDTGPRRIGHHARVWDDLRGDQRLAGRSRPPHGVRDAKRTHFSLPSSSEWLPWETGALVCKPATPHRCRSSAGSCNQRYEASDTYVADVDALSSAVARSSRLPTLLSIAGPSQAGGSVFRLLSKEMSRQQRAIRWVYAKIINDGSCPELRRRNRDHHTPRKRALLQLEFACVALRSGGADHFLCGQERRPLTIAGD